MYWEVWTFEPDRWIGLYADLNGLMNALALD